MEPLPLWLADGHGAADGLVGRGIRAADRHAVGGGADTAGDGLFRGRIIAGNADWSAAAASHEQAGGEEDDDSVFHFGLFLFVPL